MKDNAELVGEVVTCQTALATGQVDILVGGGEFVTAGLHKENPALDFSMPEEGAVLLVQSIGVFKAMPRTRTWRLKFMQYILSPEGQARLATSSCYWGMPANTKAALTDEQKTVLRLTSSRASSPAPSHTPAPDAELDTKMQDVWTEMLQH